jgi:hypothetical protein
MRDLPNQAQQKPAPSVPPKTTLLKIRQASRKRQSGGKGRG